MFRPARRSEAVGLRDLERAASLVALEHIFPPTQFPYPDEDVLSRWRRVLADDDVTVLVADDLPGLTCVVAFNPTTVQHLAIRPDRWGDGLGRRALEAARLHSDPRRLWCLEGNDRALGFYRRLGWQPTGGERAAEWPPFPREVELVLPDRAQSSPAWVPPQPGRPSRPRP